MKSGASSEFIMSHAAQYLNELVQYFMFVLQIKLFIAHSTSNRSTDNDNGITNDVDTELHSIFVVYGKMAMQRKLDHLLDLL